MENLEQSSLFPEKKDFKNDTNNALLHIKRPDIREKIINFAQEKALEEKPEFHISVIATRNGKKISDILANRENSLELKQKIKDKFESMSWAYKPLGEYYLMSKYYNEDEMQKSGYTGMPEHSRFTLIQKVEMPELEVFYDWLQEELGEEFDVPVPHTTLFSGSDYEPMKNRGLGIYSQSDFDKYMQEKIEI